MFSSPSYGTLMFLSPSYGTLMFWIKLSDVGFSCRWRKLFSSSSENCAFVVEFERNILGSIRFFIYEKKKLEWFFRSGMHHFMVVTDVYSLGLKWWAIWRSKRLPFRRWPAIRWSRSWPSVRKAFVSSLTRRSSWISPNRPASPPTSSFPCPRPTLSRDRRNSFSTQSVTPSKTQSLHFHYSTKNIWKYKLCQIRVLNRICYFLNSDLWHFLLNTFSRNVFYGSQFSVNFSMIFLNVFFQWFLFSDYF